MNNINLELHKLKQETKDALQNNQESIKHMLKTIDKYMGYSKWKETYDIIFVREKKENG